MEHANDVFEVGRSTAKEHQENHQMKSPVSGQKISRNMRTDSYVEMGKSRQISIQDKLLFSSLGLGRARAEADNNHNIQRVLLDKEYLEFERKCSNVNVNRELSENRKGKGSLKLKENARRSRGVVISDVEGSRKGISSLKLDESASRSPGGVNSTEGGKLKEKSCLKLTENPSKSAGNIPMEPELLKRKREHLMNDIRSSKSAALSRHIGDDSKGKTVMKERRARGVDDNQRDIVWEKRISDPKSAIKNVLQLPQHVIKTGCLMSTHGVRHVDLYDADQDEHHNCQVHTVHRDKHIEQFLAVGWYEFAKNKGLTKGDVIRFCIKDRTATRISVRVFKEVIYVG